MYALLNVCGESYGNVFLIFLHFCIAKSYNLVHEENFQFLNFFFIRSGSVIYIFINKNIFGLQG